MPMGKWCMRVRCPGCRYHNGRRDTPSHQYHHVMRIATAARSDLREIHCRPSNTSIGQHSLTHSSSSCILASLAILPTETISYAMSTASKLRNDAVPSFPPSSVGSWCRSLTNHSPQSPESPPSSGPPEKRQRTVSGAGNHTPSRFYTPSYTPLINTPLIG